MRAHELFESRTAPLYHGTGLGSILAILASNSLHTSQDYDDDPDAVSLTRDPRIAAGFMGRNGGSDLGGVLVLDQRKLAQRYRIQPFAAVDTDGNRISTEEEEIVLGDIKPLDQYLLSINIEDRVFRFLDEPRQFDRWFEEVGRDFSQMDDEEECRAALAALRKHPLLNRLTPRGSPAPRPYEPFDPEEMRLINAMKAAGKDGIFYPTNMYGVMDDRELSPILTRLSRRDIVQTELVQGDVRWSHLHVTRGPNWQFVQDALSESRRPVDSFLAAVNEIGKEHYRFSDGQVFRSLNGAIVRLEAYGPSAAMLMEISTSGTVRKQGHGSALLAQVCALADRHGITLYANAYPIRKTLHDRPMPQDALTAWYVRHGFEIADEPAARGVNIVRKPR